MNNLKHISSQAKNILLNINNQYDLGLDDNEVREYIEQLGQYALMELLASLKPELKQRITSLYEANEIAEGNELLIQSIPVSEIKFTYKNWCARSIVELVKQKSPQQVEITAADIIDQWANE